MPSKLGWSCAAEPPRANQLGRSQPNFEPNTAPRILQATVKRAQAQAARRARLLARPVDLVVGAIGFDRPGLEVAALGVQRAEAAGVERPQVHAGIAVQDPVGHGFAGAAGSGDAGGEAAGEEQVVELRRRPEDRLAVGRDGDRSVDHRLDADVVEHRQPQCGGDREQLEALEIGGEQLAAEFERRQAAPAALGALLPAADGEGAGVGLEIEVVVGIAQRGEGIVEVELLLGQEILVLDDAGGNRDAGHRAHALRPDAGAVDEDVAADGAAVGEDTVDAAARDDDLPNADAFLDLHAVRPRPLRIGHGQRIGIDVAVAGNEGGALDAFGRQEREALPGLGSRQRVTFDGEAPGLGHRAADLAPARGRGGKAQRSRLAPGNGAASLLLEAVEDGDGILHQPGEVALAAELADEARRMPGRAVGEPALLGQQDIRGAGPAQMIGERGADDPSPDDEDAAVAVGAERHG